MSNAYYTTHAKGAIALKLLSQWDVANAAEALPNEQQRMLNAQQFKAEAGSIALLFSESGEVNEVWVGTGKGSDAKALALALCRLPAGCYASAASLSEHAKLNWALAQYRFETYKKSQTTPKTLVVSGKDYESLVPMVEAVCLVRDLINTPTNDMGPSQLAKTMQTLAKTHHASFKEWIGEELLTANFPAIHAVGRASADAPRLLKMTWGKEGLPLITLVGKGVCFDSGGLDIKPSSNMRLMKKDMGGAAQVLGLAHWIMAMHVPVRLHVYIPAVENAVGSRAYRPGDVLTMRNGLTVEIDNTDAEGRLVLADALTAACEENPALIIDFATLTGAARTAVGTDIAAMFTPEQPLAHALTAASEKTNDPIWQLPLFEDYEDMLESSIADLVNSPSSSYAGATTAALFLKRFVEPSIPWVHFDVMAWNLKNKPGKPIGGEAMGIRAVAQYLLERFGNGF